MPSANVSAVRELIHVLTTDELVHVANYVAGALSSRFDTSPEGEPQPGFIYPAYDREAAASAFRQAARYIETPTESR